MNQIYLASRSPRRAELLLQIGLEARILPSDIDESVYNDEAASDYVQRLAAEKAAAGASTLLELDLPVLAADTTVCVDGRILGKPEHDEDACAMLTLMSGRWHEVYTAIAVLSPLGLALALSTTRVQMASLSERVIADYVATGEPRDKAGAYGIQGLGGTLIEKIEGSYSGVMGLPLFETATLLRNAGIAIPAMRIK
ncbi:Maf family nucleotide pyrophosphatase [Methylobacillus gramineus]|uniref:Maf family protein n=1 Tax=Methylobacillus gramineus TaxID=755169 RepID=UPI001CFFF48E|nr:Maf family protein [Methylobacillus gramineus]MCB5186359.1 Maf family nucleotide pyrophosphatase [Methylobacillus gramineus]